MIECLSEIGIDDKDLQIISKLYWEQSACVRTESGMTSEFKIKKGVRQGCVLSPNLFNLYTESYGSVGVETPVPVRSPKLSNVEPS